MKSPQLFNHCLLCGLIFCYGIHCDAQQLPLFTQYREYQELINPAAANSDFFYNSNYNLFAGISHRIQWAGKSFSPYTQTLHGTAVLGNSSAPLLAGGYLMNDQTGPSGFTGIYGRLACLLGNRNFGKIAAGISLGLVQYRIDGTKIKLYHPDALYEYNYRQYFPDAGVGIYYFYQPSGSHVKNSRSKDYYYAGISIPQVLNLHPRFARNPGSFPLERTRHYYGLFGCQRVINADSYWEPSIWIKYVRGAPLQVDLNLRFFLEDKFWMGTGGSPAGWIHFESGFLFKNHISRNKHLKIGYGFDYYLQRSGAQFGTSHEINLSVALERKTSML